MDNNELLELLRERLSITVITREQRDYFEGDSVSVNVSLEFIDDQGKTQLISEDSDSIMINRN